MSEFEKMLSSKLYKPQDEALAKKATLCHRLCCKYNKSYDTNKGRRKRILNKLLHNAKDNIYIQGPIYFDYGINTVIGENFYANYNLTILDCARVTIGDNCFFGPNVSIVTPLHALRYQERNYKIEGNESYDLEYAKPIVIGNNCWLASNVIVCPGVTIGDGCVIGAGSVVTSDIKPNMLAYGNPCKMIREIKEEDSLKYKKELL